MSRDIDERAAELSPISRRAFFQNLGTKALKIGIIGTAAASLGSDDEGGCRINIPTDCDDGGYCDYVDTNCGYCDAEGQDYEHCDGEYCDYINYADYSDEGCGYCDGVGQDYEHCDGEYCDYINYADA